MTKEEYIESIVSQIDDKAARAEFRREIEAHLDDRIAFYTDAGYDYDYALDKAIGRMGDTATVGSQMNNLYDTTTVNGFIWALAWLNVVLALFTFFGPRTTFNYMVFDYADFAFRAEVFVAALAFLLASKHRNHKALTVVSATKLFLMIAMVMFHGIVFSRTELISPLITAGSIIGGGLIKLNYPLSLAYAVISAFGYVYLAVAGIVGIMYAAQIKSVINGTARTNILKRYRFMDWVNRAAIVSKIASLAIFIYFVIAFIGEAL